MLVGKNTDYFFVSIIKKKKDILDGGGERKEIPKLSKFSKFLTRIQTKKVTNINFQYIVKLFILISSLLDSF